jgi:hypothetical protein
VKRNPIRFTDPSGRNTFEDLAQFIRNQAGFEQEARTPPTFQSSNASPFGTAAHRTATGVVQQMQHAGFVNANRVVSEPVIVNDTIVSAGTGPAGAPRGSLCPDLLFTNQGTQGSVVGQQASAVTQELGDLKYGGGNAAAKYQRIGAPVRTVNGVTSSAATDAALLQSSPATPAQPAPQSAPQSVPPPEPVNTSKGVPAVGKVVSGAALLGMGGQAIKQLHEGDPVGAATTVGVGLGVAKVVAKNPALLPIAIMVSTIQSYDDDVKRRANKAGDWVQRKTGNRVVGGLAASAWATGDSIFQGTFGTVGRGIGEGAAALYIRATSDEYTWNPLKSQAWSDFWSGPSLFDVARQQMQRRP